MRIIGKGRNAASKFCAVMNLPQPVSSTPYSDQTKHISEKSKKCTSAGITERS